MPIGDSFDASNSENTLADHFTFTVSGTVGQNLDAIVASISRSADIGLDITGVWLSYGNDTLLSQGTSLHSGATDVWTVGGGNLSAGDYYLRVNGTLGYLARRRRTRRD